MKRVGTLFACAVLVGLFAPDAKAGGTENSVTITTVTPSTGQVAVEGEYTVAIGYSQGNVLLLVQSAGGGAGEGGEAVALATSGSLSGTVEVPAGQYDVQAVLEVVDGFAATSTTSIPLP